MMKMDKDKAVKSGTILYRYDIVQPPAHGWNNDFKSPIYDNYMREVGPKNSIGAFFFFDDKTTAIEVAKNILKQKEWIKDLNPDLNIWLTTAYIREDLYMLDLSGCNDVVDLYVNLWNENIDIFRDDFYKYGDIFGSKPMSQLRQDVKQIADNDNGGRNSIATCKCNIFNFYNTFEDKKILPFACQELTDFSNGGIFKELLENKGYEGYIFRETDANTFCLFNPNKLSKPQTIIIDQKDSL